MQCWFIIADVVSFTPFDALSPECKGEIPVYALSNWTREGVSNLQIAIYQWIVAWWWVDSVLSLPTHQHRPRCKIICWHYFSISGCRPRWSDITLPSVSLYRARAAQAEAASDRDKADPWFVVEYWQWTPLLYYASAILFRLAHFDL